MGSSDTNLALSGGQAPRLGVVRQRVKERVGRGLKVFDSFDVLTMGDITLST